MVVVHLITVYSIIIYLYKSKVFSDAWFRRCLPTQGFLGIIAHKYPRAIGLT